jgi:hypothetical protein
VESTQEDKTSKGGQRLKGSKASKVKPQERNGPWVWVTAAQETGSARGAKLWSLRLSDDTADSGSRKGKRAERASREEPALCRGQNSEGENPRDAGT